MNEKRFNIRVYGLLINPNNQVLVTDEDRFGMRFTKFPGGGLEFGEGLKDCLKREFLEELNLPIEIEEHFYTTDFFQSSAFNPNHQLISIYYKVWSPNWQDLHVVNEPFENLKKNSQVFRWVNLERISITEATFPVDQLVIEKLKKTNQPLNKRINL